MSIEYVVYDSGGLISEGCAFWKPTICKMGTNECHLSAKVKKGGNDPYFVTSCFENKNDEMIRYLGL